MPLACTCAACRPTDFGEDTRFCNWCEQPFELGTGFNNGWGEDWCSERCWDVEENGSGDESPESNLIHNYSWTPPLNFLRADDDPDDRLFLGFELEVPSDQEGDLAQSIYDGPGREESVLYCKEDGSIDGVEIVSHPMTHKYLRENFDFSMFKRTSPQSQYLRSRTPGDGYGLHVHVSRAGFKNEAHALRWLLLIYRNESLVELIARRNSGQWAGFRDNEACVAKAKNRDVWSQERMDDQRRYMQRCGWTEERIDREIEYAQSRRYSGERYAAVNAQNANTFEVRVFRSTWSRKEFRAALDFVHASVTYTRELKAVDALRGGLSAASFVAWLTGKAEYADLASYIETRAPELATSVPLHEHERAELEAA